MIAAPAAAAAPTGVGAGSYTTDVVGPLPSGCGDLSTNPRQFMTANAPIGAVPTNDWWSSLVFKKLNCNYSENLEAHPAVYLPGAAGLGFAYPTTPAISTPGTGSAGIPLRLQPGLHRRDDRAERPGGQG